ncbi:hypothetical protein Q8F55_009310 [Vanrija albida]|uniref:Macro domain-containing protein n=1 Tax=Vanrija albida TaxID=181172 RepID=A0ABR3PT97_9TREE
MSYQQGPPPNYGGQVDPNYPFMGQQQQQYGQPGYQQQPYYQPPPGQYSQQGPPGQPYYQQGPPPGQQQYQQQPYYPPQSAPAPQPAPAPQQEQQHHSNNNNHHSGGKSKLGGIGSKLGDSLVRGFGWGIGMNLAGRLVGATTLIDAQRDQPRLTQPPSSPSKRSSSPSPIRPPSTPPCPSHTTPATSSAAACQTGVLVPGGVQVYRDRHGATVYNIATQDRPGPRARVEWLREGLDNAFKLVAEDGGAIALPRIGAGIGGLSWELEARPIIVELAEAHGIDVEVWSLE